jgi:hypothetical protein
MAGALREALSDHRPEMGDFAWDELLQKMGRTAPEAALNVVRERVAHWRDESGAAEANRALLRMNLRVSTSFMNHPPNDFPWRALVAATQAQSIAIAGKALAALAKDVSRHNPLSHAPYPCGLNSADKALLGAALSRDLGTNVSPKDLKLLKDWIR